MASHFSIERLFAEIRRHMPTDCEVSSCPAPEASAGILPRVRNVLHAARQRADVHHIVGDSHYLAFGLPGKKTVLTIHDCAALDRLSGWRRAILKYLWFTGPMRRATVVTTISQATKDELRKWVGPLADKVVVVPDCVFDEFAYDPKPFDEECPVVLQVGTKWNKNVERVIEAVASLQPGSLTGWKRGWRGCRLEIVGTLGRDQETKRLRDEKTEGLRDSWTIGLRDQKAERPRDKEPWVHELGRLTDAELVEAYRRCDMVVFASLYEGFGLPILEAQATGRPVITSNFGAMKEAAGGGALFVDPYSVEAIRDAVLRVMREPALREDLIAKGLENVERFRAAAVAQRYAEIYRSLKTKRPRDEKTKS